MFQIRVEPKGLSFETDGEASLLLSAARAGVVLPSSCRNGTCRTCICQVTSGSARHLIEWPGLSLEEKREGYILPCVAVATSDLTIAAPAAKLQGDI
ncbi:2Fe-2S iron-sulfur cluster binding domain-containing protein [Pseudoduganella eburnea]|uniref:2Fe-2S iron-sulfur cluster binding domain-containing protein n=1 Tax=Massilia eburnea TaxID=1776165 RepID=A0A6L6QJA5_9BURK|nr:2Fe-2S iron-sulfur cluster binding domain-containing protein [Massilia eburnea]